MGVRMFRIPILSKGLRFLSSESYILPVVCLVIGLSALPSSSFTIDRDSVNFTDTLQSVFFLSTSGENITIDTIKVRRITAGTTSLGLALMFDTGHYCRTGCGVQGMGGNCTYYESGENVYVKSVPLLIRGHDSVKVTNLFFSTALAKKANASLVDDIVQNVVVLKFVSSTGECDSLQATVGSYFFDQIVKHGSTSETKSSGNISVWRGYDGFTIHYQPTNGGDPMFSIYDIIGQQVTRFPENSGNKVYWNTGGNHFGPGLYVVKAELPDKTVLTRTFMFTR